MKKTLLGLLVAFLALPLGSLMPTAAQAATMNTAIRGTSVSTVFWYANDGKRYVFPNTATYYTWFPSFDNVRTVSDSELYSITIGGNVTYRPGAKLVKVNTDPKVYVVARGAVLRHVTSEYLAERLFGSDWRSDVHDIADVYFTNYTVGSPIYNESDYNVSNEYNGVSTPSDSMRGMTGTGSTGEIVLNASRTNINAGEAVTLSISNTLNYGSGYRLEIYDTRNNSIVRTCTLPTSYCDVTVYPQRNNTENSVQYYAAVRDSSSMTIKSGYSPVIYFGGTSQNGTLTLSSSRTTLNSGETLTLNAWTSDTFNNSRIEIRDGRDNSLVTTCYTLSNCSHTATVYGRTTGETFRYVAELKNWNGTTVQTAYSPTILVNGTGSVTTPVITSPVNNQVLTNFPRTMTIQWNGSARRHQVEVSCGTSCWPVVGQNAYTAYLTTDSYRNWVNTEITGDNTITIRVRAIDENGSYGAWSNSVSFRYTTNGYNTGSSNDGVNYINGLVLNADRTNINPGNVVRLTANAFNAGTWSYTGNRITITDMRTNTIVKTCYDSATCLVDVYPQAYSSTNLTAQYQAKIYDRNGVLAMSQYSPVIYLSSYNGGTSYDYYGYSYTQATGRGLVTFAPSENLRTNAVVYLTATFTDTNVPVEDSVVRIYTERSISPIATCTGSRLCSVSFATGADPINTRVYARLTSRTLSYTTLESPRVNLVTTR
jgi:hypothetical protein